MLKNLILIILDKVILISVLSIPLCFTFTYPSLAQTATDTTTTEYREAPDFSLEQADGNTFKLSEHIGKVIIINIWATWCGPCRKEIPEFMELQKEMGGDVQFVGVSVDEEGWKAVRPFEKKFDITYPIVVDDGSVFDGYGPFRLIPMSFIVNKKGNLEYVAPGRIPKYKLKPILQELINR